MISQYFHRIKLHQDSKQDVGGSDNHALVLPSPSSLLHDSEHIVLTFKGLSHLYYKYTDSSFTSMAPTHSMFTVYTENTS